MSNATTTRHAIECRLCGWLQPVSHHDENAATLAAVSHAATLHGFDARLSRTAPMRLVELVPVKA